MKSKYPLYGFLLIAVTSFIIYLFFFKSYNSSLDETNITTVLTSEDLYNSFNDNENSPTSDYSTNFIMVSGRISKISGKSIILDQLIQVELEKEIDSIEETMQITIKGKCLGYDELLEMVKINRASVESNQGI